MNKFNCIYDSKKSNDFNGKLSYVFQYAQKICESDDECSLDIQKKFKKLFNDEILKEVDILYEKKRLIPMISFNLFTYKVNDYQFILKSDPEYRYVLHTNFLIENCGRDKWFRFLDENDIATQFYKVPISTAVADVWIDDSHITPYVDDREESLENFISVLRRYSYPINQNDYMEDYSSDEYNMEMDANNSRNFLYRKTLEFPDLPSDAIELDAKQLNYQDHNFWNEQKAFEKISEILSKLEPDEKIQAILSFRFSNQVIGK